jgi:predicted flap endonuclease-1-like 5' DNA nuclease
MRWLLAEMWIYLGLAFILGMAAYRWIFGSGGGYAAEDLSAELASVRTRYEERETERRRLHARIAELTTQLEESRKEARSAEAQAHTARLEADAAKMAATAAIRAARREPETQTAGAEPTTFMAALREGAPDDLTRIKGIGQKLEVTLNGLGVYYYRQIADWSDTEVAQMDAKLKFPGRIDRDDWRGQARRLLGRAG